MRARGAAAAIAGVAMSAASLAFALPSGKAWTHRETHVTPGHVAFFGVRLETTPAGELMALGTGKGGLPPEGQGLRWQDTTWTVQWSAGYPMTILLPTLGMDGSVPLVWASFDEFFSGTRYESWLIASMVQAGTVSAPET